MYNRNVILHKEAITHAAWCSSPQLPSDSPSLGLGSFLVLLSVIKGVTVYRNRLLRISSSGGGGGGGREDSRCLQIQLLFLCWTSVSARVECMCVQTCACVRVHVCTH